MGHYSQRIMRGSRGILGRRELLSDTCRFGLAFRFGQQVRNAEWEPSDAVEDSHGRSWDLFQKRGRDRGGLAGRTIARRELVSGADREKQAPGVDLGNDQERGMDSVGRFSCRISIRV